MNIILFRSHEVLAIGESRLTGERARHVREVLNAKVGDELRVGIANVGTGIGVVQHISSDAVDFTFTADHSVERPSATDLILAIPRPKVLRRVLQHAASIGVRRILLINSWRVEKSYLQSPVLEQLSLIEDLTIGLEQAGSAVLPEIRVVDRFKPFVEDELDQWCGDGDRILFHPGAQASLRQREWPSNSPIVVAIGPEGGWIPFEVEALMAQEFQATSLGLPILRVEVAVVAALSGVSSRRLEPGS